MKYEIKLQDSNTFSLSNDGVYISDFITVGDALDWIADSYGIQLDTKYSESYILDILQLDYRLDIEIID